MAFTSRGKVFVRQCAKTNYTLKLFRCFFCYRGAFLSSKRRDFIHDNTAKTIQTSTHAFLLEKLQLALKDHKIEEAWEICKDFGKSWGSLEPSLINSLLTGLCYSSDPHWLQKACDLVVLQWKRKHDLFDVEVLTKLALSMARAKMPIPASMILRLLLQKKYLPPGNILRFVILHMVKTEIGTCLASNLLIQICDTYQDVNARCSNHKDNVNLDVISLNLVLDACVRFGSALKGQQIIELMAQERIAADMHSLIIIAQLHEINGQRDEIKNYKDHVDRVSVAHFPHYQPFYNSLLSLHFKFNDIDAAAELVLDLHRHREPLLVNDAQKPLVVPLGSPNLKSGLKMRIEPEKLDKNLHFKAERGEELIAVRGGKLNLTNKALAKFIYWYKKIGRISDLSKLLIGIQENMSSPCRLNLTLCVINACIHMGWLENAHDLLDDFEFAGATIHSYVYVALLEAYYKGNMFKEANALVRQIKKAGVISCWSDEMTSVMSVLEKACTIGPISYLSSAAEYSTLGELLVLVTEEEERCVPSMVYKPNSSIYYFSRAQMMDDALKTYRRMQEMGIQPNEQTFSALLYGYSSFQMYRDITILWGDIKRGMLRENYVISGDLCESLVVNFIRGGYFERVMEVIAFMKEHQLFADKWMYRYEFLKLHRNLYRNLKASEARTEAQRKRLGYVQEFRKWAGIK